MASHNLPILTTNSNGSAVKLLQRLLNIYSISGDTNLQEDGIFGPKTFEGVENFQKYYREQKYDPTLVPDGKVGNLTWRALGNYAYKNFSVSPS
jgi:peptidoglycan hydrolase-like protein with peptidoglycan-binding domain